VKPSIRETQRPQYRRFSLVQLALMWAGVLTFLLLLWALISSSPINWTPGVVTALVGATLAVGLPTWWMRWRADQLGVDDDFLEP
jgi:membrane protein YdbS with pleckstrin-like domain